jgi:hypothetical protein
VISIKERINSGEGKGNNPATAHDY